MASLLTLLGRGAAAGAIGGVLSGTISQLTGEPSIRRAIALEEQAGGHGHAGGEAHAAHEHGAEVFSRAVQQLGLVVAATLTGVAIGIFFGLVYAALHRDDPGRQPWRRSVQLAAAGFVGVALIPFLRYPANPPAVGDPATVEVRTGWYLVAILLGVVAVASAAALHARLSKRAVSPPMRQLAVLGVVLLGVFAVFLLPSSPPVVTVPADLIWDFRLAALAALAMLWAGLGVGFGLLGERAARRSGPRPAVATPVR